jgi:P4 family phage/plasmid primase-like protien
METQFNMISKGLQFNSLKEIKKFIHMSTQAQSCAYVEAVKEDIVIIGKEQETYYYNTITRLWECCSREKYCSFVPDFYEQSSNNLREAFNKYSKELDDDDEEKKRLSKEVTVMREVFDKDVYHASIIKRTTGKLQNNQFVKLLNMNAYLFPIMGGKTINLQTKEISDRKKTDYFTFESPVEYLTKTPNADKFFRQVFPDRENYNYVKMSFGYMITGDTSAHVFFVWYGSGRNGKTVVANLLRAVLGEQFYIQCDKSIFIKTPKGVGASPEKVALIGRRVAIYSEGDTADEIELDISSIKEKTGEDMIYARGLFKDPINFYVQCKLNMLTNYIPPLDGQLAIVERFRMIFFDTLFTNKPKGKNQYKQDPDFIAKLMTTYLSEVFSWLVDGAVEYYKTKKIVMPKVVQDRSTELINSEDSIESFISSRMNFTKNKKDYIRKSTLFEIYKTYCNAQSQRCKPRSTFFNRLSDMKLELYDKDGYKIFRCVTVTPEVEDGKEYNVHNDPLAILNKRTRDIFNNANKK